MATSVKLDDESKSRLDKLQAEIQLKTDTRPTKQEILARIIERAIGSKEALIDSFRVEVEPLSDEERERFHEGMVSSGVRTAEEDIDEILYG